MKDNNDFLLTIIAVIFLPCFALCYISSCMGAPVGRSPALSVLLWYAKGCKGEFDTSREIEGINKLYRKMRK
jgi:hypothetical protein